MTVRYLHPVAEKDNARVVDIIESVLTRARRGEIHSVAIAYLTPIEDCIAVTIMPGQCTTMKGTLETLHTSVSEGEEWL